LFIFLLSFWFLFSFVSADFQYWDISIADVDNPSDWITVMDRNLWATSNDIESPDSWWYKYQWWNNFWFEDVKDCTKLLWSYFRSCMTKVTDVIKKQKLGNGTNWAVYSNDYKNKWYNSDIFITTRDSSSRDLGKSDPDYRSDWYHTDLWWGSDDSEDNWWWLNLKNYVERQWPCPSWYHVPSFWEWKHLKELWNKSDFWKSLNNSVSSNGEALFMSYFKLPAAWYRDANLWDLHRYEEEQDEYYSDYSDVWYYWSSTPVIFTDTNKDKTKYINVIYANIKVSYDNINWSLYSRNYTTSPSRWLPVRCFKNIYESSAVGGISTVDKTSWDKSSILPENKTLTWDINGKNEKTNEDSLVNSWESRNDWKINWNSPDTDSITERTPSYKQWKNIEWSPLDILENGYSREMNNAHQFSLANWLSTVNDIKNANMDWDLTRIAMAKMLSYYAINILWKQPDVSLWFPFYDVPNELNSRYDNAATLAYQLWIMWKWKKNFSPYEVVTRKEFATALSRLLYNIEDGQTSYYEPHIFKLYNEWIIKNRDPNIVEKRWYVMLMLMRSVQ